MRCRMFPVALMVGVCLLELAAAQADDSNERRGLRTNTPEASEGYVLFNPNRSLASYLVDLEGRSGRLTSRTCASWRDSASRSASRFRRLGEVHAVEEGLEG